MIKINRKTPCHIIRFYSRNGIQQSDRGRLVCLQQQQAQESTAVGVWIKGFRSFFLSPFVIVEVIQPCWLSTEIIVAAICVDDHRSISEFYLRYRYRDLRSGITAFDYSSTRIYISSGKLIDYIAIIIC